MMRKLNDGGPETPLVENQWIRPQGFFFFLSAACGCLKLSRALKIIKYLKWISLTLEGREVEAHQAKPSF